MRLAWLALLLVASCATTLVKEDIRRQSDGWTVTFHELTDGPNAFKDGMINVRPASGQHFLWVTLSVRNEARGERAFPFDSCGLDLGDQESLPMYVNLDSVLSASVSKTPKLSAGEEITRRLCYGYPDGQVPKRLVCFGNEIPLERH
jgi:hypothetical protein